MGSDKWIVPTLKYKEGENIFSVIRQLENDLRMSLDILETVKNSIPQTPASETKQLIANFLTQFTKP